MLDRLRHLSLGWWSRLVSRWPAWVLLIAGALALASGAVAVSQLRFESNRNALIDAELPWNQRFIAWRNAFPNTRDLLVVIDTHDAEGASDAAAARRAERLVDELGPRLEASDAVIQAVWGFDVREIHPRALRLEPMDALEQRLDQFAGGAPLLESPTPADFLAAALGRMRVAEPLDADRDAAAGIARFRAVLDAFTERVTAPPDRPMDLNQRIDADTRDADAAEADDRRYLRTENGRLLLIRVTPRPEPEALNRYRRAIDEVRAILADVRQDHAQVAFGLTGLPVTEADETATATRDSAIASAVAVVLIAIVLITAFHSVRVPLMLIAALAVGVGWSFGFLTLTIGHLQVISVVFVVLLLGLGVAFGIHLASGFELIRHVYPDTRGGFREALQQTLETIGPGLLTGAVTTAAAFATTMFTDFRGVAEMGMIAGAGVIFCLLAMCSVYPALLRLLKPGHRHLKPMAARRIHLFNPRWVMPFVARPHATLIVAGLVTAASILAVTQMRFDYNLVALLPRGIESVEWQRRIIEQGNQSVWSATSIADDLDEARRLTERFRELDTVESVGGIAQLFPREPQRRSALIERTRDRLAAPLQHALDTPDVPEQPQAEELRERVGALQLALTVGTWTASRDARPQLETLQRSVDAFAQALAEASTAQIAALERDYQRWRQDVAGLIDQALEPGDVRVGDLPEDLLASYIGQGDDGQTRYALEIQPRVPPGVTDPLEPAFLSRFIEDVYGVDDQATGVIVQIYESGTLIWQAYLWAGVYALLAVFVIVAIDFRSLRDAGLVLVPVAVGFSVTFAVMRLAGMNINPANIMVLPLMFGIGVDAGVHVLHRYRQSPYHRPPGLTAGTGKGVTLTSLTTMIGFGALMLASHRGIAGLGFVLAVGIGMTMLACWTIMPAWLELRNRARRREQRRRRQQRQAVATAERAEVA